MEHGERTNSLCLEALENISQEKETIKLELEKWAGVQLKMKMGQEGHSWLRKWQVNKEGSTEE